MESLKRKLGNLSCHFTWEEVIGYENNRESQLSTADFHGGDDDDGSSISEVHWRNLKGYYKCKDNDFEEARKCFEIALEKCTSKKEEKTVTLSCMAWLFYEEAEKSSDDETKENLQGKSNDKIKEVMSILKGREMENLPEVLFERASVAIHVGGNEFGRFEEANRLIDKALEGKPEALIYKFTKAKNKQKFLFHRKITILGDEDNEVNELDQLWKELIEMKSSSTDLHAEILVCYAFFLNRKYRDFGKTASPYALKAGKLGAENPYVLRKVAQFYVNSAGNDVTKLEKAIKILKDLLKKNPNCYKTQSALGKVLYRKYSNSEGSAYSREKLFRDAEQNLTKSWEANPKYPIPAMDLVRLYQIKYEATRQTTALIEAEKVFQQMFDSIENLNVSFKGGLCHHYGHFLKNYGAVLASHYKNCHSTVLPADPEMMMRITEALKSADKFEENQDHCELHKAETIFLSLYNEVYDKDNNVQMTFYHLYTWEYSCFMEKYYKDLAMLYFMRSRNYNPHQTSVTLEALANEKAENVNEKERFNGLVVLIWLYQMKYQTTKQEEYRLKAEDISKKAVKLKADEEIAKVLDKLSSLRMN